MRRGIRVSGWVMWGLLCVGFGSEAWAEGVLLGSTSGTYYPIQRAQIHVAIEKQVATTTVEQSYKVDGSESHYLYAFSTPPSASIVEVELWRGGQWERADIRAAAQPKVPAQQAQKLGVYLGQNPFRIQLEQEGAGQLKIRFRFVELLPYDKGEITYLYPLAPYGSKRGAVEVKLTGSLKLERDIQWFKSLHHPKVEFAKLSGREQGLVHTFSVEEQSKDLKLVYKAAQDQLSLRFFAHRQSKWEGQSSPEAAMFRDGYFLLMLEPKEDVDQGQIIPKHFTLVIDVSGSMASQNKLQQAKRAAIRCVEGLHANDTFNIIAFSQSTRLFANQPTTVTRASREEARRFIQELKVLGSTNIEMALGDALRYAEGNKDRPHLILFLTDGHPSAGITQTDALIDAIKQKNQQEARIFAFGAGHYNAALLEGLAHSSGGKAYHLEVDKIDEVLQRFFASINSPVLTDIQLHVGQTQISKVTPETNRLPHVYLGNQLLILGRYSSFGKGNIELSGRIGARKVRYVIEASFDKQQPDNAFLPRIWAKAYADMLYREWIRNEQDPELKKKVTAIGTLYQIQTAFTSFGFQGGAGRAPDQANHPNNGAPGSPASGYYPPTNPGRHMAASSCACSASGAAPRPPLGGILILALWLAWLWRKKAGQPSL